MLALQGSAVNLDDRSKEPLHAKSSSIIRFFKVENISLLRSQKSAMLRKVLSRKGTFLKTNPPKLARSCRYLPDWQMRPKIIGEIIVLNFSGSSRKLLSL